jgi:apolipoprotein N-acyltransferase
VLSGILLGLAFPKFDYGWIVWFGLVPFLISIRGRKLLPTFFLSYIFGLVFFMIVFYWINSLNSVNKLHFIIMGLYLGAYIVFFGLFLNLFVRHTNLPLVILAPLIWTSLEYLRGHADFLQFPLGILGLSQYQSLPIFQFASVGGGYGLSFLIVMINASIADLIEYYKIKGVEQEYGTKRRLFHPVLGFFIPLGIVTIIFIWGWTTLSRPLNGRPISISVVQGNIPLDLRWKREYQDTIISKYERLTEEAARNKPQLIIWPESSTSGFVLAKRPLFDQLSAMVRKAEVFFLIGSAEYPKFSLTGIKGPISGNTALFFSPEGKILGQYLKIYLVPFGEYIPYEGVIPWPKFIVQNMKSANIPGKKATLFNLGNVKFGTLICSEIMVSELSRKMVNNGAAFLTNISNEAWFGESASTYQYLAMNALRAVENRVNIIRASNSGLSAFIDPFGAVSEVLKHDGKALFVAGTLTHRISLIPAGTFYTRHGDLIPLGSISLSLIILSWIILSKTKGIFRKYRREPSR